MIPYVEGSGKPRFHDATKQTTLRELIKTQALIFKPLVQVVDLFCGGGGFTEGAIRANAEVVLSIDCWDEAIEVHKANHPNVPCENYTLGGSIVETAAFIRSRLTPGAHFHLHGSPPCQKLSNASSSNSEEGMILVNWFIDLVRYMKPDSWSMENVVPVAKKIDKHRPGTPYVKLNSADFGVPQTRNRIFAGEGWVAEPTHTKEDWVSVIEALPHLEEELNANPRIVSRRRKANEEPQSYTPDRPAHTITQVTHIMENIVVNTDGCSNSVSRRALSVDRAVSEPAKTVHNNRPTLRNVEYKLEALGANQKRHQDRSINEPSKTICGSGNQVGARIFEHVHLNTSGCTESMGNAAVAKDRVITKPSKVIRAHYPSLREKDEIRAVKIRSLTLSETAVLQGFNADMKLPYKRKKDAWTVLGNAVCPPVAEAIIRGIL